MEESQYKVHFQNRFQFGKRVSVLLRNSERCCRIQLSISPKWKWKWKWSRVWLFATPWTAAYQAPPSIGFSRQEYWSGVLWVQVLTNTFPSLDRKPLIEIHQFLSSSPASFFLKIMWEILNYSLDTLWCLKQGKCTKFGICRWPFREGSRI